jgi:hypothetical protein
MTRIRKPVACSQKHQLRTTPSSQAGTQETSPASGFLAAGLEVILTAATLIKATSIIITILLLLPLLLLPGLRLAERGRRCALMLAQRSPWRTQPDGVGSSQPAQGPLQQFAKHIARVVSRANLPVLQTAQT